MEFAKVAAMCNTEVLFTSFLLFLFLFGFDFFRFAVT